MTNSIGMKFVLIPPGEFDMGSGPEEVQRLRSDFSAQKAPQRLIDRIPAETPQHRVRITGAFYMGVCEVTQAQYERVMGSNPSHFKRCGPDAPVEHVSWTDAAEFCQRLSKMDEEHAEYRMPTEAEREHACRAGTTTRFCFGDSRAHLVEYAWVVKNTRGQTEPVGQKKPNPFGLYDVYGNVHEWCRDWYAEDYYADSPRSDPPGPGEGTKRVFRGGTWASWELDCRSARRQGAEPGSQSFYRGFRVTCSPSGK